MTAPQALYYQQHDLRSGPRRIVITDLDIAFAEESLLGRPFRRVSPRFHSLFQTARRARFVEIGDSHVDVCYHAVDVTCNDRDYLVR